MRLSSPTGARRTAGAFGLLLLLSPAVDAGADATARLALEIERLSARAGGTVGVGALHLESGRELYSHGDDRFPLASTYKVPIAVALLRRVDRGEIALDEMIELEPSDLHPGSGTLTELFDDPGVVLSLRNLLELMLLISDNSATDLVLARAGGGAAVSAEIKELGFASVRVDRPTESLIADYIGIDSLGPEEERSPESFADAAGALSQPERDEAWRRFNDDPRDTAAPRDLTRLLAALWRGELLSRSSTELLLDIMRRSTTGTARIPGLLSDDVEVAHKTGTIGGTTNDIGIVTLPHGAGHVVMVLLVKGSQKPVEEREAVIAQLARTLFDYFLFGVGD